MDTLELYPLLKNIHLFDGLTDEQLLEVAGYFEPRVFRAGETIFTEGTDGLDFYIILRGQVRVTRQDRSGVVNVLSRLVGGDYFGEAALIHGRKRSATVIAELETHTLRLGSDNFNGLLKRYPAIRPNLLVTTQSRALYDRIKFNWLSPGEIVYLIARRHPFILGQSLLIPIGLYVVLLIAVISVWSAFGMTWGLILTAVGGLPLVGWTWWIVIDWGNDFYIVTNKRIVYLEKIVGLYDSRQEAPLSSVLAVNLQTADATQRQLGMGDVIVRTYGGEMVMKSVANPQALAALIEEHWQRSRASQRAAEVDAMKALLRQRIRPKPKPLASAASTTSKANSLQALGEFFNFRVRFEEKGNIIYRKHWFVLLENIGQPSVWLLLSVGMATLAVTGVIPTGLAATGVLVVALLAALGCLGWWLYEFVDWRNDIYQVTNDQIIDIQRKPLGEEKRQSAALDNVLSMRLERAGPLGQIFNFGDVIILVGGQEFRFEDVLDPPGVQSDIYRRMEASRQRKAEQDASKRRDELTDWLKAYHELSGELDAEDNYGTT